MKRYVGPLVVAACLVMGVGVPNVLGITEFRKAFVARYAGDGADPNFQKLVRKAGCNVCHVPKKPKNVHNAYGEALKERISGDVKERLEKAKADGRRIDELNILLDELAKAFPEVEQLKDASGESYGQRIASGRLPVDLP